jgi:uncharacterized protein
MRKLMVMGVITVSLAAFGTGFAQNTTQPTQVPPPPALEKQSPKTTPPQTRTKAASAVESERARAQYSSSAADADFAAQIAEQALIALDPRQTETARNVAIAKLDVARAAWQKARLEGEMAVQTAERGQRGQAWRSTPLGRPAQQYKTEDEATSQCGTDQVVWGNTRSHILHDRGTQYYGKTIEGAYMCKAKAIGAGYRMPYMPENPVQHRVVIQIDQDDPAIMNLALNNADNMRKYYEGKSEKIDIEVVAFGGGLTMMRADRSPVIDRLTALSKQGVVFSGCSNTKANQSKAEGEEIRLLDGVHEVPTGVVRITELQEQGWTYLRP